ncbi:MAG: FtsX-like permease family protein [Planctomycetes bacterium]|nr:FtsX-like permease family protein [Planctomycetota bacterium]
MIAPELITESLKNLLRHKLRSFLTALGIIFGIASVVLMVSVGEGGRRTILEQISELGIRNIIVNAKKPPEESDGMQQQQGWQLRYGLTFKDQKQIETTVPMVEQVLPVHDVKRSIWFKSRKIEAKVRGVTPEYFDALRLKPIMGRALAARDGLERKRVAVIRSRLLREAKYVGDPLELDLKVGREWFQVVGVLPDFEFQSPNKAVLGIDDRALEVYVPFQTVCDRFGLSNNSFRAGSFENERVELSQMVCRVVSEEKVLEAARCIHAVLGKFHDKRDYEVSVPLEQLASLQTTQETFNTMILITATISLVVGGIGILNIMLASITERTREIGIRRALGASRGDIVLQFLVETVVIATIGGLLGVGLGVGGAPIVSKFTGWQTALTPWAIVLSLGVSMLTGIVFGLYPARRAAFMDPIEALRHE